jgi:hypothetical protein
MIDITKDYTTIYNLKIKFFEILENQIFGAYFDDNVGQWYPQVWQLDGTNRTHQNFNLIEKKFNITDVKQAARLFKEVNYYGRYLEIPNCYNYLFTNKSGWVKASIDYPDPDVTYLTDDHIIIMLVDYTGDYKNSIQKI